MEFLCGTVRASNFAGRQGESAPSEMFDEMVKQMAVAVGATLSGQSINCVLTVSTVFRLCIMYVETFELQTSRINKTIFVI